MGAADWLVIGLWLVAIAFTAIMAWEPWRATRGRGAVDLSDDLIGRPVQPGYVFVLPILIAVAPFVAQFVPHAGEQNPWRHPHLLAPAGPLALILIVGLQAYVCSRVLRAARRDREAHDQTRQTLLNAGRRSARRPR